MIRSQSARLGCYLCGLVCLILVVLPTSAGAQTEAFAKQKQNAIAVGVSTGFSGFYLTSGGGTSSISQSPVLGIDIIALFHFWEFLAFEWGTLFNVGTSNSTALGWGQHSIANVAMAPGFRFYPLDNLHIRTDLALYMGKSEFLTFIQAVGGTFGTSIRFYCELMVMEHIGEYFKGGYAITVGAGLGAIFFY